MRFLAVILWLSIAGSAWAGISEGGDSPVATVCDTHTLNKKAQMALSGNVTAQYALGLLHLHGYCGEPDRAKAASWLKLAAENRQLDAAFVLGQAYLMGEILERDIGAAEGFLRMAAEEGHIDAQHTLGLKLLWYAANQDEQYEGLYWFGSAADLGHGFSAAILAHIHEAGLHGVEVDKCLALDWYEASGLLGFTDLRDHYLELLSTWYSQCY